MPGAEVDVDYSQPLAVLLRQGTAKAHESAENSAGAISLTRGELDREEYVRFLIMLYYVYSTLEQGLERHAEHPTLAPTYNPSLLARAPGLASDIAYLLQTPENAWKSHPAHAEFKTSLPAPLKEYVSRLELLASSPDPSRLLAHAYVRYLGDLSGGQIIRRRVAKAYGLEISDAPGGGLGTKFYDFNQLGGTKSGNVGDFRKIKEWYRDGMNLGAGDDEEKKRQIVDEATKAFELNTDLFKVLRPPSARPLSTASDPLLGDPTSPPVSPTYATQSEAANPFESPESRVVASSEGTQSERSYQLASILAICLAVGIAHFTLVVGGFTGKQGYVKYQAFLQWLDSLFSK